MMVVQLRSSLRAEATEACSTEALAEIARGTAEAGRAKAALELEELKAALIAERDLRLRAEQRAEEAVSKAKDAYGRVQVAAAGAKKAKIALARAQREVLANAAAMAECQDGNLSLGGVGRTVYPTPGAHSAPPNAPEADTFDGLMDPVADFVGAASGGESRPTRREVAHRLGGNSPKRDHARRARSTEARSPLRTPRSGERKTATTATQHSSSRWSPLRVNSNTPPRIEPRERHLSGTESHPIGGYAHGATRSSKTSGASDNSGKGSLFGQTERIPIALRRTPRKAGGRSPNRMASSPGYGTAAIDRSSGDGSGDDNSSNILAHRRHADSTIPASAESTLTNGDTAAIERMLNRHQDEISSLRCRANEDGGWDQASAARATEVFDQVGKLAEELALREKENARAMSSAAMKRAVDVTCDAPARELQAPSNAVVAAADVATFQPPAPSRSLFSNSKFIRARMAGSTIAPPLEQNTVRNPAMLVSTSPAMSVAPPASVAEVHHQGEQRQDEPDVEDGEW